jgi:hypothetical protein
MRIQGIPILSSARGALSAAHLPSKKTKKICFAQGSHEEKI